MLALHTPAPAPPTAPYDPLRPLTAPYDRYRQAAAPCSPYDPLWPLTAPYDRYTGKLQLRAGVVVVATWRDGQVHGAGRLVYGSGCEWRGELEPCAPHATQPELMLRAALGVETCANPNPNPCPNP